MKIIASGKVVELLKKANSNRTKLITYLQGNISSGIQREIQEKMSGHQDDNDAREDWPDYSLADAFNDVYDECISFDDIVSKQMKRQCEDILIAIGYYIPRSPGVYVTGERGTVIRNKIKYDPVSSWVEWIDK